MYVKNVHCIKICVLKANISAEVQKRNHSTWLTITGEIFMKNVLELRLDT